MNSYPHVITVDRVQADYVKSLPRRRPTHNAGPSEPVRRLMQGEMLFTRDEKWKPSSKTLAKNGLRLHQRKDDGGYYYWTTAAR